MEVQDLDQGANGEFAVFVDPTRSSSFVVTPAICRGTCHVSLLLNKRLDYEEEQMIEIQIYANETGNSTHYSVTNVILEVENVNDNSPSFPKPVYNIQVREDVRLNTVVARLQAYDEDEGKYGKLTYSISSEKFVIDISTGEIILVGTLDREEIDRYRVLVSAADGGTPPHRATSSVTIHVTDVNDNMPQFSASGYSAEVTENERPSGPIAYIWCTDVDAPPNNDITYDIIKTRFSRHFKIKKSEDGSGEVFVKEPLDYESVRGGIIRLQILATDSGNPPHNSTVPLVVTVVDINDNSPIFQRSSSENISVPENLGGGVKIGQVHATDRDQGKNKMLRYLIDEGQEEFDKVFYLNEYSGDITIKPGTSPDYETMSDYDVTIVAEDQGIPMLSTKHRLRITVTDVNDNPPVFKHQRLVVTFEEGLTPVVTTVTATDEDLGVNGEVRYRITEGNIDGTFVINEESGQIVAKSELDFESSSGEYRLVVTATDQADSEDDRLSSEIEVIINVIDLNDNPPIFQVRANPGEEIVCDVTEGIEGPRIEYFKAVDEDAGRNGFVTYEVCDGNDEGLFTISHSEGDLRVRAGQILDRETSLKHKLLICATDAGTPPLNASLPVTIRVVDVNDNAPTFSKFLPVVRISEDARVGSVVSRVASLDPDEGEFGRFIFKITAGDDEETFRIHKRTGIITLSKPLDRETVAKYDLEITVKDNPSETINSRSTIKVMEIVVTDINDNPPRFVGRTPYHGQIEENSPVESPVTILGEQLHAVDDDFGSNANISYSIISDDVSFISDYVGRHRRTFFSIDSGTGVISTRARFDREVLASDTITLVVRASDPDRQHSDVTVIIEVTDVNDNPPQFRSKSVRVRVKEDTKPGSEVTHVVATDKDLGENAKITYRIESGSFDKFTIEPGTGVIKVAPAQFLDREKKSVYDVTVVAVDNGIATSLSSTCAVTIEVTDVNDSRPKFVELQLEALVLENSPPGTLIARVGATDPDLTSDLRYNIASLEPFDVHGRMIVPGNGRSRRTDYDVIRSWFALNATSGEISVALLRKSHMIDRELCPLVRMLLSVRDENSVNDEIAEASEQAVLTITIGDENDNSPSFVTSSFNGDITKLGDELIVDITEESVIGSTLVTLKAIDPDQGNNGRVIYDDVTKGSNVQLRDSESGTLIVSSRIDHENLVVVNGHAWVNTTILAQDLGTPEIRSKKLKVAMRVRDINDNNPRFERRHYRISVPENTTLRSELLTVSADDPDSGAFGEIIYTLKGGRNTFSIQPISGKIHLSGPLDREATAVYNLVVVATDNLEGAEQDRRETSVPLTIAVEDVNDCEPVFIEPSSPRTYSTQENAVVGSFVAVVTAEDPDEGTGAQITYSLKESRISSFFNIQPSSGHVTIRRALTALPRHLEDPKIEVIATDGGGISNNMTLYLDIVDVNDHVPMFEEPDGKEMTVLEEEPAGTQVGWMKASDTDSGLNGIIRYSFCDVTKNDAFLIDDVTGRIVTSKRLDRETVPEYTLQVCANDLGVTSLRNSAYVTIRLLDRNDKKPEFPKSNNVEKAGGAYQELHASEGLQVGESVGDVMRAVDSDSGPYAHVYYHLVAVFADGHKDMSLFSIQKENGRIVLEKPLDREQIERYKLIIKATNDKYYSFPSAIVDDGKKDGDMVRRNVGGKSVSRLKKTNAGNEEHKQIIASSVPMMMLMAKTTDEEELPVELSSPSFASLLDPSHDSSLIEVAIVIDDVNDEWPVFEHKEYVTVADAEAEIGTEITKVKANDGDIGNNSIVTYTTVNTYLWSFDNKTKRIVFDTFRIHPQEGAVSTARRLKDYQTGYFELDIEARDSANHFARTSVFVYIVSTENKIKFVVNSPPNVIREKKNQLIGFVGNISSSLVLLDDVAYHVMQNGRRDDSKSDVTIRAFDKRRKRRVTSEEMKKHLERNRQKLEEIFGNCAVISEQLTPDGAEGSYLLVVVIIMLALLFFIILVFSALYYRMQRRYKRELEALAAGTLAQQSVKHMVSSQSLLSPSGEDIVGSRDSYPSDAVVSSATWKEDYDRRLSEQKLHEIDEFSVDGTQKRRKNRSAVNMVSKSASQEAPRARPRSHKPTKFQRDPSLPRSRTDVWSPSGENLPVPAEILQQFMREQQRRRKRAERKARLEKNRPTSSMAEEKNRWSLKQDTSSLKRCGRRDESSPSNCQSEDYKSDSTVIEETQPRVKDKKKAKKELPSQDIPSPPSKEVRSPGLSLHSGGNSEDIIRKHSMTLHGSDVSEHSLKEYLDSDATPTNMTSSSPSHLTSSLNSVNQISDL